ncbi:MAG: hypothetical protein ISR50_08530 [Alphaproteobacteria bacterium]|nr:hypothetical protein [Alphaproteobacteria bacterium]
MTSRNRAVSCATMLSLPKILLFLAVAAIVVLISKSLRGRGSKPGEVDKGGAENEALDLAECTVCGNFVAAGTRGCERADCPHAV